ncbi:MAG: Tryptophan synthase alpha chain [Myxococcaceae bacterium]|nr:Tryptophan synthase alpha chain [Myxococcaceae bacterium]
MRTAIAVRSLCIAAAVAAVAIACGSSDSSQFTDPTANGEEAGITPPPGTFVPAEGGTGTEGGPSTCKPKTCVDLKATCGPIGDGCGNVVQCGTCDLANGETCGGGGVPSACGKPACKKLTCADNGATCGVAADGCGGVTANCGTCNTAIGESCNGTPSTCSVLVGSGDGGADGGAACVPTTCAALGQNCGGTPDGCGGFIASCGTCNAAAGDTCGGGGVPSVCGHTCKPLTACPAGLNCGPIADGCGGVISCGPACTAPGQICGGGGVANVCGGNSTCTGLCSQQTTCPGGGTTSISGTVTTPNGVLPIYGALVYIPNGTVQPFTTGVTCEQCGAASGAPLVSTTTGPDGKFLLSNVPVSSTAAGKTNNIPVVVQLGRWRKQFTVVTSGCTNTLVPAVSSALPHNKAEGDIPLTAISTGQVDGLECVFRKIGIDDAEFTDPSGNGRIRFYKDNGAVRTTQTFGSLKCSIGGAACGNNTQKNACQKAPPAGLGGTCVTPQTGGTPPASALYNDPNELAKYDLSLFECVGSEQTKTATARANVLDYANKGGRVYATHFSYVWLNNTTPWSTTASWGPQQDAWNSIVADIDTTFGKGQAFAQWLNIVGGLQAALPATPPPWVPAPKITIQEARHDVDYPVSAAAQRWLYTTAASTGALKNSLQHYTFNTDVNKAANQQCGRVLFSDFHVSTGSNTTDVVFPAECDNNPLTTQEKVLAFMLFDLASCVNTVPPSPPACTPKTCAQQGIDCGQAGDGCGNVITCPPCAAGTTCGGAGVPNKCGAPPCAKKTCAAGQCGTIADGCGGTAVCNPCVGGTCGGGGIANMCGAGVCTPAMCPAPAAGSSCGAVSDNCGGVNTCACPAGTPCVNGKCTAPPCTPISCAQAGANCGQVADGCGKLNDCGMCLAPQICGGGGTANVCGGGVN